MKTPLIQKLLKEDSTRTILIRQRHDLTIEASALIDNGRQIICATGEDLHEAIDALEYRLEKFNKNNYAKNSSSNRAL